MYKTPYFTPAQINALNKYKATNNFDVLLPSFNIAQAQAIRDIKESGVMPQFGNVVFQKPQIKIIVTMFEASAGWLDMSNVKSFKLKDGVEASEYVMKNSFLIGPRAAELRYNDFTADENGVYYQSGDQPAIITIKVSEGDITAIAIVIINEWTLFYYFASNEAPTIPDNVDGLLQIKMLDTDKDLLQSNTFTISNENGYWPSGFLSINGEFWETTNK